MALLTAEDLARHRWFTWALLGALGGVALWLWAIGKGSAAWGTLAALLGCLGLILPPRERMPVLPPRLRRLPRWADALPVAGTILTSPGYGLGWFYGVNPFDEVVHLVNGVFAGAILAGLVLADGRRRGVSEIAGIGLAAGLTLALGWEAFEWATGLVGDWRDTASDIAITAGGVGLGAATVAVRAAPRWSLADHPAE
ncbi:MAG: hypothetical protein K2X11_17015 [Acetobacteraceae bacterium]|nr:hypothetical protein [Acetobacteraceae bacterium]